jgi:hypothetical protein
VGVADVEGDADAVEVAYAEDFEEVLGGGDLVLKIFKQDADAEGMREGFEVLDGGEGVFQGAEVPGVILVTEVEGAGGDGNLLGGLEGALDLVHGGDAAGFFRVDQIEVWGDMAGPLGVGAIAEVERLVERGSYAGGVEPGGDVPDGSAVGVVEVMASGEELDDLSAGSMESVEQAGVQALREEDVGRVSGLHHLLRYSSGGLDGVKEGVRWVSRLESGRLPVDDRSGQGEWDSGDCRVDFAGPGLSVEDGPGPAPKIKALNDWLKGYCVVHSVTYLSITTRRWWGRMAG